MTRRFRKTNRPHRYDDDLRAKLTEHALKVSINDAARTFKVAPRTVHRCLVAAGHTPRRQGTFTLYDDAFVAKLVAHRKSSDSTKATSRAFGVSEDTVRRFCGFGRYAVPQK